MGKYDGVIADYNNDENQVKFNLNDFHWTNDYMININKNLKFILHQSQYSDKFTIKNDVLDIDKDKIQINAKSIVSLDSSGVPDGIISVNNNDKLTLNYSSDFMVLNGSLYCNLAAGLTRDDQNRITIALASCNLKFVNNQLCLDMNAMINDSNCIKLDSKQRLRLHYNNDDFIKDSTGKLWLKIYDKHLKRTQNGIELNVDNDTIRYDNNESKLIAFIDKYVVPQYAQNGDIYLDSTNNKMKLNINNYIDDNIGSKIIMNEHNKVDLNIVNQRSGEIYFSKPNELSIRPSPYFTRDSSGHLLPVVNNDHSLNLNNHKLNLDVSAPLDFENKKLTLSYDAYFKLNSNKLDIDITKLQTDIIIPKQNEGILLNSDGSLSLDKSVLTNMINVGSLSGLKIIGNQLIVDEGIMSSNIIRLDSNSTIKRRANNFYEILCDRGSIDSDFTTGALKVKDGYIKSIISTDYLKNNILNQSYYKDLLKFQGPVILKKCALCWWDLDIEADVDKTISTNVIINKFQNQQHKFNDFNYFICKNSPTYHYKHYSFEIFPEVITDNYIYFNNTNQRIKYTDIFNKLISLKSIMFNFIIEPKKKSVDINSTLIECENDNYIKLLYNNQGIVFKFGKMTMDFYTQITFPNEIVVATTSTMLNKKNVITFFYDSDNSKILIIHNSQIIYNKNDIILFTIELGKDNLLTHKYHDFYLGNNADNSQSFNGKFYDYSMLQNITESEAINLHEYYKYIHNI